MKKKLLTLVLSLTLAFSLAACGSPKTSGPVDRDPVSTTDNKTPEESSADNSSAEESSEESSSALAAWYDSADRKTLEDSINKMFSSSGMNFSLSIEEPDTIIYTYQYTETQSDDSNREILHEYFRTSLDEQYKTFIDEIQNFKNAYNMPLTTIRISYLDADGTDLCTMDFTEDYVPSTEDSSSQEYASLEDWMNSDEQRMVVSAVNSQLESSGISIEFYAEGNVMVMDYTYTEQQDLEGLSQEDIASVFDEQVAPTFSSLVSTLFDSFESDYGLVLDDIKLIFRNADGTELYSKYFSEM
ncbi:MAG: DUF4854 domain-containing protein [Lachnospiraceae bacterium]|nr:DUF4854 domain-containing protein [Lachnospiraceae bacterium]